MKIKIESSSLTITNINQIEISNIYDNITSLTEHPSYSHIKISQGFYDDSCTIPCLHIIGRRIDCLKMLLEFLLSSPTPNSLSTIETTQMKELILYALTQISRLNSVIFTDTAFDSDGRPQQIIRTFTNNSECKNMLYHSIQHVLIKEMQTTIKQLQIENHKLKAENNKLHCQSLGESSSREPQKFSLFKSPTCLSLSIPFILRNQTNSSSNN